MARESPVTELSRLSAPSLGVFRGRTPSPRAGDPHATRSSVAERSDRAGAAGYVSHDRGRAVRRAAPPRRAAWAGPDAAQRPLGRRDLYGFEGVRAPVPEIVVPRGSHVRGEGVTCTGPTDRSALMLRTHRGLRVTGAEPTLVRLAHVLDAEAFEIACEDARRRRLTSIPALTRYLDRFGGSGRPGVAPLRALLRRARSRAPVPSTLEVKTRRLLVANGITDFVRELPLDWNGRSYRFDFAFARNGRSSRPTVAAGTTTPSTTSTTTRSGACRVGMGSSSCWRRGKRSRAVRTHSSRSCGSRSQPERRLIGRAHDS